MQRPAKGIPQRAHPCVSFDLLIFQPVVGDNQTGYFPSGSHETPEANGFGITYRESLCKGPGRMLLLQKLHQLQVELVARNSDALEDELKLDRNDLLQLLETWLRLKVLGC